MKAKKDLQQFYDQKQVAKTYWEERFISPLGSILNKKQIDFVQDFINRYNPLNILDIASGPGRVASQLSGHFKGTILDSSAQMLFRAREELRRWRKEKQWNLICGDAFKMSFQQTFQLVACLRFIRHFKYFEREQLYQQIRNVLDPDGILIIDVVNFDGSFESRKLDHLIDSDIYDKLYRLDELYGEIEKSGFQIVAVEGVFYKYLRLRKVDSLFRTFRLTAFEKPFLRLFERKQSGEPLEWLVACQKKKGSPDVKGNRK